MESQEPQLQETIGTTELSAALEAELRKRQDLPNAFIGGLAAAILGALIWAVITVATEYQIGYMAIGVGLLAGFGVRYFGCGIDSHFRVIGAFFALLGCALGNLLSQVGFIAAAESLGYYETITLLNFDVILTIYTNSFSPMDIFFYAIAIYEGFKFSVVDVSVELDKALTEGRITPQPFAKWKVHIATGIFIVLATGFYFVSKGTVGIKTYYYESGGKRAVGETVHGNEVGYWETFWENGNLQSKGFYADGKLDSLWEFNDEQGILQQRVSYKNGLQHGDYLSFYGNGAPLASGKYNAGRSVGHWIYKYEDGQVMSEGDFELDLQVGPWVNYYSNGYKSSSGSYKMGAPAGKWHYWFENGQKSSELNFEDDGKVLILNTWSKSGEAEVVNGSGVFKSLFEVGTIQQSGMIKDGKRIGTWITNYEDGNKQEEGYYKNDVYYISNTWTPTGEPLVVNGEGTYETYYDDGAVNETGLVQGGLRKDEWVSYGPDHAVLLEMNYVNGKLHGDYKTYFDNGLVSLEGVFHEDKRTGDWKWYTADGNIESEVRFNNGKKEGIQKFYDDAGAVIRIETYTEGVLIASQVN